MENVGPSPIRLSGKLLLILIFAGLSLVLVLGAYVYVFHGPLSTSQGEWGLFGDYVGGILNPVLSFLALIGLLFTISLQSAEMRDSTKELRNSAQALKKQNESINHQIFESAFFNMMRFYADILRDIDIRANNANASGTTIGRDCFKVFYRRFKMRYEASTETDSLKKVVDAYKRFHAKNQADVGHYFRHLYHIIKFVDRSDVEDKKYYTNLVRAQLSSYESTLLFYNCITDLGSEKFKPLVEKYSLLKNMPKDLLLEKEHRALYSENTYK